MAGSTFLFEPGWPLPPMARRRRGCAFGSQRRQRHVVRIPLQCRTRSSSHTFTTSAGYWCGSSAPAAAGVGRPCGDLREGRDPGSRADFKCHGDRRDVPHRDASRRCADSLAHRDDACVTPPQGAKEIADKLTGAPKVDLAYFSGGAEPESGPCDPLCPHGFFGIEPAVIDRTVTFMRSCTAEPPGRVHESVPSGLRRR